MACAGLALPAAVAAEPTRPLPTVRIEGRDYVAAREMASRLGLAIGWEGQHHLVLSNAEHRIEFPALHAIDAKEVGVDGLIVWLGDPPFERMGEYYVSRIDFERRLEPLLRPDLVGFLPPQPRIIVLDPGHGGSDTGTRNPRLGLMEKTFTLDVGLRLRALLERHGFRVVMTRTTDTRLAPEQGPDLRLRDELANEAHADLFLSIHFNAGGSAADTQSHGTEIYTFSPEYQRSTRSWAMFMNDAERFASPGNRWDAWNIVFAHAMHRALVPFLRTEDRGERINQLGVLRDLNCPGILVESAFISDDAEGRRVATAAFRQQIAVGMLAGIEAYAAEIEALRRAEAR